MTSSTSAVNNFQTIKNYDLLAHHAPEPKSHICRNVTIAVSALFGFGAVGFGLLALFGAVVPGVNVIMAITISSAGGGFVTGSAVAAVVCYIRRDKPPLAFTVMSWNVGSSDDFVNVNPNDYSVNPKNINYDAIDARRSMLFQDRLTELDKADIICLQECFASFKSDKLRPLLSRSYEIADTCDGDRTDTLIAWNRTVFDLVESYTIRDENEPDSTKTAAVLLCEKRTNLTVLVASVHIPGFNLKGRAEDLKDAASSGDRDLRCVKDIMNLKLADVKIIAGDFNSSKETYVQRQEIVENAGYASATLSAENNNTILTQPTYQEHRLDWIYAKSSNPKKQIQMVEFNPRGFVQLPGLTGDAEKHHNPSDHLPVINGFVVSQA